MVDCAAASDRARAREIVPGSIHVLGGSAPVDGRISWLPGTVSGWLPLNCYLLDGGAQGDLIVDTGVALHREQIVAQLRELLGAPPGLVLTRYEQDTMSNLRVLVEEFGISSIVTGGGLDPLDFFDGLDRSSTDAHVATTVGLELLRVPPSTTVQVNGFRLQPLATSFKLLSTYWMYEHTTRTLFSSDSWSFGTVADPSDLPLRRSADGYTVEAVASFLMTKFDWLAGAQAGPLLEELRALAGDFPIERICPSSGCVIEGGDVVAEVLANTTEAVRRVAALTARSPLEDPRWQSYVNRCAR